MARKGSEYPAGDHGYRIHQQTEAKRPERGVPWAEFELVDVARVAAEANHLRELKQFHLTEGGLLEVLIAQGEVHVFQQTHISVAELDHIQQSLKLTKTEAHYFQEMVAAETKPVTFTGPSVTVHISRIRKKLREQGISATIYNVATAGVYLLADPLPDGATVHVPHLGFSGQHQVPEIAVLTQLGRVTASKNIVTTFLDAPELIVALQMCEVGIGGFSYEALFPNWTTGDPRLNDIDLKYFKLTLNTAISILRSRLERFGLHYMELRNADGTLNLLDTRLPPEIHLAYVELRIPSGFEKLRSTIPEPVLLAFFGVQFDGQTQFTEKEREVIAELLAAYPGEYARYNSTYRVHIKYIRKKIDSPNFRIDPHYRPVIVSVGNRAGYRIVLGNETALQPKYTVDTSIIEELIERGMPADILYFCFGIDGETRERRFEDLETAVLVHLLQVSPDDVDFKDVESINQTSVPYLISKIRRKFESYPGLHDVHIPQGKEGLYRLEILQS